MVFPNPFPVLVLTVRTRTFGSRGIDHDEMLLYVLVK